MKTISDGFALVMLFAPCALTFAQDAPPSARRTPPVTFNRILHAEQEPQNWLTYSGTLSGTRYSPLTQITRSNLNSLELAWIWQAPEMAGGFEATPLVVDGILYMVRVNDAVALDAATGRVIWTHSYAPKITNLVYRQNRGLAILGDTLFMGTLDAHLLAINTGNTLFAFALQQ